MKKSVATHFGRKLGNMSSNLLKHSKMYSNTVYDVKKILVILNISQHLV